MFSSSKTSLTGLVILVIITCQGCSQSSGLKIVPVDGTVTLNGEPLADGLVTFYPQSGRPSSAKTDSTGHFDLRYTADQMGAAVGSHEIHITYGGQQQPSQPNVPSKTKVVTKAIPRGEYKSPEPVSVTESNHHFDIKIP